MRNVEAALRVKALAAGMDARTKTLSSDLDILRWMGRVRAHHETRFSAQSLGRPRDQWLEWRD